MGESMFRRLPSAVVHLGARAEHRVALTLLLILLSFSASATAQAGGSLAKNPLGSLLGNKNTSQTTQPAPPPSPAADAQPPTDIPLPEVASRAEELTRLLRDIRSQLPTQNQLDTMKTALTERETLLQTKKKEVDALLAGSPSGLELREQETYWHVISTEGAATRKQLLDWANAAQSAVQQLQALQPQWTATLEENKNTPDLGPTLDVIRDAVKGIQTTKSQAQDLLRVIVNLQVIAANQHQLALDAVDRLGMARAQLKDHVLQRDSLPLWQVFLRRQQGETREFFGNAGTRVIGIKSFVRENSGPFFALALLLVLSLFGAYRLFVMTRGIQPRDERQAQVLVISQHWVSLGILPPLLVAFLLAPLAPLPLIGLAILISFFSILVLLPPLIEPRFHLPLYCLVGVYVCNAILVWITLSPSAKREAQFFVFVAAIVLFAYFLRPARVAEREKTNRAHAFLCVRRARGPGGPGSGAGGKHIRLLPADAVSDHHVHLQHLYRRLLYLLRCASSFCCSWPLSMRLRPSGWRWCACTVRPSPAGHRACCNGRRHGVAGRARWSLMGVRTWVNEQIVALLDFNIVGGSGNITLGGVLGFWAILLAGFAFSTSLRFLLREELLKRLHLKRGIPELISTTLHYLLLLLVFLFAVNAGGVALNKFTVLTGALGVGVGFGLQNIINNFVSGLILQFERPIRVGDVVELEAGVTGAVTRIGIRSSTVQTFQGAEVIIPNASFISSNVTNWTLSEAKRTAGVTGRRGVWHRSQAGEGSAGAAGGTASRRPHLA